jgi:lipid II:glycine glycyltransferase (peptidoglycan interpeptide bridge formation enzyme)
LEETLNTQHNAKPVHSVEEIERLATLFSDSIKLFVAIKDNKMLGGTLVFENKTIVHTQYLANSFEGRNIGALDFVIDKLINEVYSNKRYFDFGISNEDAGRYLNTGLIAQKEGFGARAVVHDFYELEIK